MQLETLLLARKLPTAFLEMKICEMHHQNLMQTKLCQIKNYSQKLLEFKTKIFEEGNLKNAGAFSDANLVSLN